MSNASNLPRRKFVKTTLGACLLASSAPLWSACSEDEIDVGADADANVPDSIGDADDITPEDTTSEDTTPEDTTPPELPPTSYDVILSEHPELTVDGGILKLLKDNTGAPGNIFVTHSDADNYIALSDRCTHRGCSIKVKTDGSEFICPCHNATFDFAGAVTGAPAIAPLREYTLSLDGDVLTIDFA